MNFFVYSFKKNHSHSKNYQQCVRKLEIKYWEQSISFFESEISKLKIEKNEITFFNTDCLIYLNDENWTVSEILLFSNKLK